MSGLMDQFRRPTGRRGRVVAALMNLGHKALTLWGLTHVNIEPNYVILDVGCGGGKTVSRLAQQATLEKVFGMYRLFRGYGRILPESEQEINCRKPRGNNLKVQ